LEAVADRSGWKIVKVYEDAGISGAKGRDQRPGLDAMMKAVNSKEFDMVATGPVDRLGRSLTDLLGILYGLHEKGVGVFLHPQGLDTSTTAAKAMLQMLGGFAEFERGIIRERGNAGLARAKANGTKLGRRRVKPSVAARILELGANGDGILKIGRKLGIGHLLLRCREVVVDAENVLAQTHRCRPTLAYLHVVKTAHATPIRLAETVTAMPTTESHSPSASSKYASHIGSTKLSHAMTAPASAIPNVSTFVKGEDNRIPKPARPLC
jgi:DNA invertase Pin-like site-specific DNA recombinase